MRKQSLQALYKLGRLHNLTGGYWRASEILRKLVELKPNDALAHYQLGFALLQQFSRRNEAIKHFRKAVDICPQLVRAYYFLGWALVRVERDFAIARQLVDELKHLHPNEADHLAHLIYINEPRDEK